MRVRHGLLIAGIAGLVLAASAFATNIATVKYAPPKIMVIDKPEAGSQEDVVISKDGDEYLFAQPVGLVTDPNSEPGCTGSGASNNYRCPVAGIKKIVLNLRTMNDGAAIDLGSKAKKVTQILNGGEGEDTLTGGPGPQMLNGGPGIDSCDGGPGHDIIKNCE